MEWLPTDNRFFKKCSNCGAWWDTDFCQNTSVKYCPKCGDAVNTKKCTDCFRFGIIDGENYCTGFGKIGNNIKACSSFVSIEEYEKENN